MFNGCVTIAALSTAGMLRPWRQLPASGPPWPWLLAWAVMPLLWGIDRYTAAALVQPMSGAVLLVLLAGWPMAIVAMLPVAALTALAAHLDIIEAIHRLVWLGIMPATLALGVGAVVRHALPRHLFVYIFGRGFLGTLVACTVAGALSVAGHAAPTGTSTGDLLIAQLLASFGEAFITGMLTAILVAFHPRWLATYADRLYLPRDDGSANGR